MLNWTNILNRMKALGKSEGTITGEALKRLLESSDLKHNQSSIQVGIGSRKLAGHIVVDNHEISEYLSRLRDDGNDLAKINVDIEINSSDWLFIFFY